MNHDLSLLDSPERSHSQEVSSSRPGADDTDHANHGRSTLRHRRAFRTLAFGNSRSRWRLEFDPVHSQTVFATRSVVFTSLSLIEHTAPFVILWPLPNRKPRRWSIQPRRRRSRQYLSRGKQLAVLCLDLPHLLSKSSWHTLYHRGALVRDLHHRCFFFIALPCSL